jgi:hypothetical protein
LRLLLDTNVPLEAILGRENADSVVQLMQNREEHEFFLSDYAFHSIAVLLVRRQKWDALRDFVNDIRVNRILTVVALGTGGVLAAAEAAQRFGLDFDDAYQYAVAEKFGLALVSFDRHFDLTPLGRRAPGDLLH